MAAAGELNLKVDQSVYEAKISELEGYLQKLYTLLSDFQAKRSEVDNIWEDADAEEYKQTIDTNMQNVEHGIKITQNQIYELRKLLEVKSTTEGAIKTTIEAAKAAATGIFF